MAQPSFKLMWQAFPDHTAYPTLRDLHTYVGGTLVKNIDGDGFGPNGNTCAVRMSRALNYGNMPVSRALVRSLKIETMTGADKLLYMFRVRDLKKYLKSALGVTPSKVVKDFGTAFAGKRGIVAFDVTGWSDASGHVALWDGSAFREQHDDFRGMADNPKTTVREPATTSMTLWEI